MRKLFENWGKQVQFLDVMIRQAHPGPEAPPYDSLEQKMHDAEKFGREENTLYPVLFDDVQGMVHQVYGGLADPTYLIDADGRVAFYSLWTHAPTLHKAIEELLRQGGRGVVKGGIDRTPHIGAAMTDGWRGIRRGLPQSFIDMELTTPGSASLLWLAHQFKPVLAPLTLRGEPLPRKAKLGLALGGISLAALGGAAAFKLINERNNKLQEGEKRQMKLKDISKQVMVITGATSGIGLTTARMAAEQGARLMLIARNEEALRELCDEINDNGGLALFHAADVADEAALHEAARGAIEKWGRIDTWVNNAGAAIYGKLTEVSNEDSRRLFDTNFWGVVNGSRVAVDYLRDRGGALINVGSEVSDSPVPLIGMYSASKHAVKGFTDSLRMELEAESLPISVTLIKPTAIHTPFPENAKNYMANEPTLPPPVYAPELVAEAILHCAQKPVRDFFVGEMAAVNSAMATYAPRLHDKFMEKVGPAAQDSGEPSVINRRDGLHETNSNLRERGSENRFVLEESIYQRVKIHPVLTAGLLTAGGIAIAAFVGSRMTKGNGANGKHLKQDSYAANKGRHFVADTSMNISEHMEVVGSDGEHVGIVDEVDGDQIKLTKSDWAAGGQHHLIPVSEVESVEENRVMLGQTGAEAKANWQTARA